nr:MmcB family DNA repair protein [uncultured Rhodoferax sp.]
MTHDELQNDLAAHLRGNFDRMIWVNTQLGPVGSPRPDVFTVNKSFAKFRTDAYEIKVSVSDLRSDVTSGKWQSYRKFGNCVWFAFPRGMAPMDMIPKECGVILRSEAGWRAARKPVAQVLDTLPRDAWLKLLMDLHPMDFSGRVKEPRTSNDYKGAEIVRKRLGDKIGRLFSDVADSERALQWRKDSLAEELAEIEAQKDRARNRSEENAAQSKKCLDESMYELGAVLGIKPEDLTSDALHSAIMAFKRRIQGNGITRAIELLQGLQGVIEQPNVEIA